MNFSGFENKQLVDIKFMYIHVPDPWRILKISSWYLLCIYVCTQFLNRYSKLQKFQSKIEVYANADLKAFKQKNIENNTLYHAWTFEKS